MSLNESWRPTNLTPKEEREALRAVYGIAEKDEDMTPQELSYEERIKMRRYLDSLDQKEAGGMKEFDLNKPPTPPYVFREYPFTMYNHELGTARLAHNYHERQQLQAGGWSENPAAPLPPPEIELSEAERAEAGEMDRLARKRKS